MIDVSPFLDVLMGLPLATSLSATDNVLVFTSSGLKRFQGLDKVLMKYTVADGVDLDTLTADGIYAIGGNSHPNKPSNSISRSQMIVLSHDSVTTVQFLFNPVEKKSFMRSRWSGVWNQWICLAIDASYVAPNFGGGVNYCSSVIYAFSQKGGLRNGRYNNALQHTLGRYVDNDDDVPQKAGFYRRPEQYHSDWNLLCGFGGRGKRAEWSKKFLSEGYARLKRILCGTRAGGNNWSDVYQSPLVADVATVAKDSLRIGILVLRKEVVAA